MPPLTSRSQPKKIKHQFFCGHRCTLCTRLVYLEKEHLRTIFIDTNQSTLSIFCDSGYGWFLNKILQFEIRMSVFKTIDLIKRFSFLASPCDHQFFLQILLDVFNQNCNKCFLFCSTISWHLEYGPVILHEPINHHQERTDQHIESLSLLVPHVTGELEMLMGFKQISMFEKN